MLTFSKKKLSLIFCILTPLFAFPAEIPDLRIGFQNDRYTGGFSTNNDDAFTFGFSLFSGFKNFELLTKAESYTYRGFEDSVSLKNNGSRIDQEEFIALYKFPKLDFNKVQLKSKVGGGLLAYGNLGLEQIQNLNHKTRRISGINVPYDESEHIFTPKLTVESEFSFNPCDIFLKTTNFPISLNLWADFDYAFNFNTIIDSRIETVFGKKSEAFFALGLGIIENYNYISYSSKDFESWSRNGPYFSYFYDTGFFKFELFHFFNSNFSYGNIIFEPTAFSRKKTWKSTDLILNTGISFSNSKRFMTLDLQMPVPNKNLLFIFKNSYLLSTPLPYACSDPLQKSTRTQKNESRILLGAEYLFYFDRIEKIGKPFLSLTAGLSSQTKSMLDYRGKSFISNFPSTHKYVFTTQAETGFYFFPEGFFVIKNTSIHPFLSIVVNATAETNPFSMEIKLGQKASLDF
ncbi:MAG: hypothetical protein MJ182_03505 [Treponema sp.]|nr:hypothetical protein [Treponema sp.]